MGWKYLSVDEDEESAQSFFVPHFIVNALRRSIGQSAQLIDATPVLMHPQTGHRAIVDVDQLAAFEWAAVRCSEALFRIVAGVRVGDTEFEAVGRLGYEGDPVNVHTMFASVSVGETIIGLRSPTARCLKKGDGANDGTRLLGSAVFPRRPPHRS